MPDAVTEIPITLEGNGNNVEENTENNTEDKAEKEDGIETKEPAQSQPKQRSVSFNRDVHVKRFGKARETRAPPSSEYHLRKEPFTHLSEQELFDEAAKVIAQADSVSCTADHPPEKFFSLPHRRKQRPEHDKNNARRNSADLGEQDKEALGRSTSDVGTQRKRGKERTSLSTLFRRAKTTSPDRPVVVTTKQDVIVTTKPGIIVQRSKSDVSDLKSNTNLNSKPKPIRKRSGSESEEFLKSLRNKKAQLSPIIEASPREDYFKKQPLISRKESSTKTSTLSALEELKKSENSGNLKVNPIEKPPRFKSPEKQSGDPKPPTRIKRSKAVPNFSGGIKINEEIPITETPKRKTDIRKTLLVDEIDQIRDKDTKPADIKDRIKESIHKLQNHIYGEKEMIHSSQKPPDKPPLTKGQTVDHIVKILKEDQFFPPPKAHLIVPPNIASNNNQPFSYTRPSASPDPNLYIRPQSPERPLTPVNKMYPDKGVVYAQVIRNQENGTSGVKKQTVYKTYSPPRGNRYGQNSDEDEGLGQEDQRNKYTTKIKYDYDKLENDSFKVKDNFRTIDSPITPRFRDFKPLKPFEEFEPTYANEFPVKSSRDFVDSAFRGRADGMDSKRRPSMEPESAKLERSNLNDLSHRRQMLESRMNARRIGDRNPTEIPRTKYLMDNDPISEAENRMKATEKYVNETARYYRRTLERDGYVENSIADTYSKIDSENNNKAKYNSESKTVEKIKRGELDRRNDESIYRSEDHKQFPPEPEYEPPSLESNVSIEKKYKTKSKPFTTSHDALHTGQKYSKTRDDKFGKRKGHYASNPEIVQEREEIYQNAKYDPKYADTYHNSLRRDKSYDRHETNSKLSREERIVSRHGSYETRDYKYDRSPRSRFDIDRDRDNRFVDSGIENDFRKDSSGEINRANKIRNYIPKIIPSRLESDDDGCNSSLFIANERRHTEDNYPSEKIYANGDYHDYPSKSKIKYASRERSIDDGSHYDPRIDRLEHSPVRRNDDKVSAKPPKPVKKLSGLEKVKQLFSSSKKSKKEKEIQSKPRTRVLKSPEHLAQSNYREYDEDRRGYKTSLDRSRYGDKDDLHRRYKEYRGSSEDRDSDHRSPKPSDVESELKSIETTRLTRSRTKDPVDSPRLAERYSHRRRLATPSPTPSPPRRRVEPPRPAAPPETSAGNWFKSLDRLTRKRNKASKVEKESGITTEDESTVTRKTWKSKSKPQTTPAKNLRFFGDTDQDSDANVSKHTVVTKSKSHPQNKTPLRKTISNSSNGIDEIDRSELSKKSYSLSNLREDSPKRVITAIGDPYKRQGRNLHNISEIHSNSETESQFDESHLTPRRYDGKLDLKPPMSPSDRRSRSHSSSKNVVSQRGSRGDLRRNGYNSSRSELRGEDSRGSSSELRISKERSGSRGDLKSRRRTPGVQSGESSTEGESSHQSQRSVVYLHATTIGDIPDPTRGRPRDDASSVQSAQAHTVVRSFSLLAPWRPRHRTEPYDVHYAQTARNKRTHKQASPKNDTFFGKTKSSSTKNLSSGTLQKNRSASQTTLNRKKPPPSRLTSSSNTLYRKGRGSDSSKENINTINVKPNTLSRSRQDRDYKKSMSTEVLTREREPSSGRSGREKIARSISMPKDNSKKAGWFKLTKNKKAEQTSRVR